MSVYLKPAAERGKEREAAQKAENAHALENEKSLIAKDLNDAEVIGKREIWILAPTEAAMAWLRGAGYTLKFNKAMGMGDMDSVTISW